MMGFAPLLLLSAWPMQYAGEIGHLETGQTRRIGPASLRAQAQWTTADRRRLFALHDFDGRLRASQVDAPFQADLVGSGREWLSLGQLNRLQAVTGILRWVRES